MTQTELGESMVTDKRRDQHSLELFTPNHIAQNTSLVHVAARKGHNLNG